MKNAPDRPKTHPVVSLWVVDLRTAPESETTLSSDEVARANAFRSIHDRKRFVATRSALRAILAEVQQRAPAEVVFEYSETGKPRLPGNLPFFNVSHSGDWALIAVSEDAEVGVDLEQITSIPDLEALIESRLSSAEITWLYSLPKPATRDARHMKERVAVPSAAQHPSVLRLDVVLRLREQPG